MKLLIVPNFYSYYDINMISGLSQALTDLGLCNKILRSSVFDSDLNNIVKHGSFDCVLRINKFRPSELDKNVRHISWFQDFDLIDRVNADKVKDGDIIYSTSKFERLGIPVNQVQNSILPMAVDANYDKLYGFNASKIKKYDFGLAGFIPEINRNISFFAILKFLFAQKFRSIPIIGNLSLTRIFLNFISRSVPYPFDKTLMQAVELNYKPLTGTLDIQELEQKILDILGKTKSFKKSIIRYIKVNYTIFFLKKKIKEFYVLNCFFDFALHNSIAWCCREHQDT